MDKELIVLKEIVPAQIFNGENLDPLLKRITDQVKAFEPDTSTEKGRKEVASIAFKIARSKTLLDSAGKDLVSEWKEKAKMVDAERKRMRDYLDNLKEETRKPLTEWEEAEAARIEAERLAAEYAAAWDEAIVENDLFDRQRAIEAKEAELKRQEEEKAAAEAKAKAEQEEKERKAKEESDRKEREARIAKEAAERAEKEAARKVKEAELAAKKAERDRIAAEERAKVEKELAAKKAREATAQAVKDAQRKAEEKEKARIAKEAAEKAKAEKAAANKRHQKKINNEALACFEKGGVKTDVAKEVIRLIAAGSIDHITINY